MARFAVIRHLPVALASIYLALTAGGAAAQTGRPAFDHAGLAKQALEHHIRPLYADFADKAGKLRVTLETACKLRDGNDTVPVKLAYRDVVVAWARTEHLRFGPVIDGNRYERVIYWPDRQRIGERQVAQILARSDATALAAEELAKKSVAVQGLTALEMVIYGKTGETLLADAPEARFACGYASAIAANIDTIAKEVVAEWADGASFTDFWQKPSEENPLYKERTGTTIELLKAYRSGIFNSRDLKLLPSLGLKRVAVRGQLAPKSRPPFELSGFSLASMIANVEGSLDLYSKGGFAERLSVVEPETARLTKVNIERAIESMRALEASGSAVFNESALMEQLAHVRDPLAFALSEGAVTLAEVSGLGALILGFTDDDGD